MQNNMPEVSVVMSVFNDGDNLAKSIDSILNQTFTNFEFIIVNDGSTDLTSDILTAYKNNDVRIKLIQQDNKGLASSLNTGINNSKAQLIARMDSDDVSLPERLEKQVSYLNQYSEVDILGSAAYLVNTNGEELGVMRLPSEHDSLVKIMHKASPFIHPSVMMRRKAILLVGGYRDHLKRAQDYELWSRLFERCRFHNLKEPLLIYTVRERLSLKSVFQAAKVRLLVGWRIGRPITAARIVLLNVVVGVLSASYIYRSRTIRGKRWYKI
jgi:glycosyltransferase EpsE